MSSTLSSIQCRIITTKNQLSKDLATNRSKSKKRDNSDIYQEGHQWEIIDSAKHHIATIQQMHMIETNSQSQEKKLGVEKQSMDERMLFANDKQIHEPPAISDAEENRDNIQQSTYEQEIFPSQHFISGLQTRNNRVVENSDIISATCSQWNGRNRNADTSNSNGSYQEVSQIISTRRTGFFTDPSDQTMDRKGQNRHLHEKSELSKCDKEQWKKNSATISKAVNENTQSTRSDFEQIKSVKITPVSSVKNNKSVPDQSFKDKDSLVHSTNSNAISLKTQSNGCLKAEGRQQNSLRHVPTVSELENSFSDEDTFYELILGHFRYMEKRPIIKYAFYTLPALVIVAVLVILYSLLRTGGVVVPLISFRDGLFSNVYILVGITFVIKSLHSVLSLVWGRICSNDDVLKRAGQWAVITGCTNGIGKEYARQLAAKGINVCLISKDTSLLLSLSRDIGNEFGVRTMVITANFNTDKDDIYQNIRSQLHNFDVGILVNNVGVCNNCPDYFHRNTDSQMADMLLHVNLLSMAKMTQTILPGMVARRRGIIINMSSAFGRNPSPFLALYGATKRFVDCLSLALDSEYRDVGIIIQSVTPYFVSTNMTKQVRTGPLIPRPDVFVRNALSTVGRVSQTHGYWPHTLEGLVIRNLPMFLQHLLMRRLRFQVRKLILKQRHGNDTT